jgi:hypothetical protein
VSLVEIMTRLWTEVPHDVGLQLVRTRTDVTAWWIGVGPYRLSSQEGGGVQVTKYGCEVETYPLEERGDAVDGLIMAVTDKVFLARWTRR